MQRLCYGLKYSLHLTFQATPNHLIEEYKRLFSPAVKQPGTEAGHSAPSYALVKNAMPSRQLYLFLFSLGGTWSVAKRKRRTEIKVFEKKCVPREFFTK
jgi:hypothetical protein